MKLVRFGEPGAERPGAILGDRIVDCSRLVVDWSGPELAPESLSRWSEGKLAGLPIVPADVRLGPPVAGVGKIIGIGLNYRAHATEAGLPVPEEPVWFLKATSALSGPNDKIVRPAGAERLDWEVELAVIIGRTLRSASANEALSAVAGYATFNDVSERDFQIARGGQWTKGKSCDTFAPLGPIVATTDEVGDPQRLGLTLSVNGVVRQSSTTADMIFTIAEILASLSGYMTLQPGDIVATGTPAGVGFGMDPKVFLQPGDVVEASVTGLGSQRQLVVAG